MLENMPAQGKFVISSKCVSQIETQCSSTGFGDSLPGNSAAAQIRAMIEWSVSEVIYDKLIIIIMIDGMLVAELSSNCNGKICSAGMLIEDDLTWQF